MERSQCAARKNRSADTEPREIVGHKKAEYRRACASILASRVHPAKADFCISRGGPKFGRGSPKASCGRVASVADLAAGVLIFANDRCAQGSAAVQQLLLHFYMQMVALFQRISIAQDVRVRSPKNWGLIWREHLD
jgi:hypothetical protein